MKVLIQRARTDDADVIAGLWVSMMEEHQEFEKRIRLSARAREAYAKYARHHAAQDDSIVLVAEVEREARRGPALIVGFSLSYRVRNLPMFFPEFYGFISDIVVAKGFRGQGHGHRMVEQTEKVFRRMGLSHVQLQAYRANDGALRFWRRLGYAAYIDGMWKDL